MLKKSQMEMFRLPPILDLKDESDLGEQFKKWKRELEVYMLDTSAMSKPKEMQTAIILHCGGPGVLEIYDQFEFEDDDEKHVPKVVLVKIEEYCNPKQNQVIQTFSFLQGYVLVPSRDFKERTWMI